MAWNFLRTLVLQSHHSNWSTPELHVYICTHPLWYWIFSRDLDPYCQCVLFGIPIFERPPPKYSAYSIMKLLFDHNIDKSNIALKWPIGTTHSATFVVDCLITLMMWKRIILGSGSIVVHIQKSSGAHLMSKSHWQWKNVLLVPAEIMCTMCTTYGD